MSARPKFDHAAAREMLARPGVKHADVAARFGVHVSTIVRLPGRPFKYVSGAHQLPQRHFNYETALLLRKAGWSCERIARKFGVRADTVSKATRMQEAAR